MANEDVLIQVAADLSKALKDFEELEKKIKSTKSTVDNQLNPTVNNFSTRLSGAGQRISGFGQKIKGAISGQTALAFTALGAGVTTFTKNCIDSAIKSESAWTRFGALVNQNGGNWQEMSDEVKGWATDFSNSMGYAVSDTREAATNFLQLGMSVDQMKSAMNATTGVAARTGMTEAEASNIVTQALLGKGRQLEKMTGLRIDDYKNADGQIDRERLLKDLYEQNTDAINAHGKTTEAQMNRINNSMGKLKTGIGQALLPVVTIVADVVQKVVDWFNKLEGPIKPIIAGFIALVAGITTFIGVLGMVAPIITNVGDLISSAGDFLGKLKLTSGIGDSWNNLKDKVGSVKDAISNLNIGDKVQAIKDSVLNSWNTLKDKISAAKTAIMEYDIKQKLVNAGSAIKGHVLSAWTTLTTNIKRAKDAITAFELRQKLATIAQKAHTIATTIWSGVTKAATMIQGALNAVLAMNPIYLVVIAVMALIAVLGYLYFNNEQVRNAINGLGSYLQGVLVPIFNTLKDAVSGVITWFTELFNGSKSLEQALGDVWNVILNFTNIGGIISALTSLSSVIGPIASTLWNQLLSGLSDVGNMINDALSNLGMIILQSILNYLSFAETIRTQIFTFIMNLFTQIRVYVGTLLSGFISYIIQRFMSIILGISQVFLLIVTTIRVKLMQARLIAGTLANSIKNIIIQRIQSVVTRIRTFFSNIVSTIRSRLSNAASSARSQAVAIYNNIVSKVQEIPGKIGQEVGKLKDIIRDKLVAAAKQMFSSAQSLVSNFLNGIAAHSPGKIQRTWLAEMSSLAGISATQGVLAAKATGNAAKGIVSSWSDNMDKLTIPFDEVKKMNDLNIGFNISKNKLDQSDINLIGQNFEKENPNLQMSTSNFSNQKISHINKNLIIESINLEMGNLDTQQSKKVVWNALQGVYDGM